MLCAIELFNVINIDCTWMKYIIVTLLGIALSLNTANSFLCVKDMKQNKIPFITKPQTKVPYNQPMRTVAGQEPQYQVKGDEEYS